MLCTMSLSAQKYLLKILHLAILEVDYRAFGLLHSHAGGALTLTVAGVKSQTADISANIFTHSSNIFTRPHSWNFGGISFHQPTAGSYFIWRKSRDTSASTQSWTGKISTKSLLDHAPWALKNAKPEILTVAFSKVFAQGMNDDLGAFNACQCRCFPHNMKMSFCKQLLFGYLNFLKFETFCEVCFCICKLYDDDWDGGKTGRDMDEGCS